MTGPIPLAAGMRVTCVRAEHYANKLTGGARYTIAPFDDPAPGHVDLVGMPGYHFDATRFKPVIRVKAKCVPSISVLIQRSKAAVAAMTPAEREAMHQAQRASWARGEAALSAMGLG